MDSNTAKCIQAAQVLFHKKIYGVGCVGEGNKGLRVVGERGKQYQNILYKILKDTFKNTNKIK